MKRFFSNYPLRRTSFSNRPAACGSGKFDGSLPRQPTEKRPSTLTVFLPGISSFFCEEEQEVIFRGANLFPFEKTILLPKTEYRWAGLAAHINYYYALVVLPSGRQRVREPSKFPLDEVS